MRLQAHCVAPFGEAEVGSGCSTNAFYADNACSTGFCLKWSTCSTLCIDDADCPADWSCREQPAYKAGGVWEEKGYTVRLCLPPWASE